jgi:hypothetical protein
MMNTIATNNIESFIKQSLQGYLASSFLNSRFSNTNLFKLAHIRGGEK